LSFFKFMEGSVLVMKKMSTLELDISQLEVITHISKSVLLSNLMLTMERSHFMELRKIMPYSMKELGVLAARFLLMLVR